jgi:hypothetical protein
MHIVIFQDMFSELKQFNEMVNANIKTSGLRDSLEVELNNFNCISITVANWSNK